MYTLLSVDWDTNSEQLRWMMDKMGAKYLDIPSWPRLTQEFSSFPILLHNDQVYTKTIEATVFLYASNLFNSGWRAYAYPEAIDLQEYFDNVLFKAGKGIFYYIVLSDTTLFRKYIINSGHFVTDGIICDALWPFLYFYFKVKTWGFDTNQALNDATDAFAKAEKLIEKSPFLCGSEISAADISFISHSMGLLWPTGDDLWAENCNLEFPALKILPQKWRQTIQKFRRTKAGLWAMKCMSNRKSGGRSLPSKYSSVNYPPWARSGWIKKNAHWFTNALLVLYVLPFVFLSFFHAFMLNTLLTSAFAGPILFLLLKRKEWVRNVKNFKI